MEKENKKLRHIKPYQPSNGSEGMIFIDDNCMNCINCDPNPDGAKQCMILCNSMAYSINDKEYPKEWVYIYGKPTCTSFKKWDWENDGDPDDLDNPKAPILVAKNQLSLFTFKDYILQSDKILYLTLTKHWFNMIAQNSKSEEYRDIKAYWVKRLLLDENGNKLTKQSAEYLTWAILNVGNDFWTDTLIPKEAIIPYDKIVFKNGYGKNAPTMVVQYKGLKIGKGIEAHGAEKDKFYFKLQLGKVIFRSNE